MFHIGQTIEYIGEKHPHILGLPLTVENYDDCIGIITIQSQKYRSYERKEGEDGIGRLKLVRKAYKTYEEREQELEERKKLIEQSISDEEYKKIKQNMYRYNKSLKKSKSL